MSISRLSLVGSLGILAISLMASSSHAYGQLAPAPQKAPRTPVKSLTLSSPTKDLPKNRILSGTATVLDTNLLRIEGFKLRLFGIISPKMEAPMGPQTRIVLDALAKGTINCQIKDRTREGIYLATCANESNSDFGIELLRRGLAVAERKTLSLTGLAEPYLASEHAAQKQRLGLWQTQVPPAASSESIKQSADEVSKTKEEASTRAPATALIEVTERAAANQTEELPRPAVKPTEIAENVSPEHISLSPEELIPSVTVSLGPAGEKNEVTQTGTEIEIAKETAPEETSEPAHNFDPLAWLERNQIFATGILFLLSSFVLAGGHLWGRQREARRDLSAMAAALRGELMAARAIGRARINKWNNMEESDTAVWPRIRVLVFQANISRLGMLGADLSRQLASIYGQASDFASYYARRKATDDLKAKKQALQTLLDHIEEVLPRLENIESTGRRPLPQEPVAVKQSLLTYLPKKEMPPTTGGTPVAALTQKTEPQQGKDKQTTLEEFTRNKKDVSSDKNGSHKKVKITPLQKQKNKVKDAMRSVREQIDAATRSAAQRLAELRNTPSPTEHYIPDYANLTEEEIAALSEDNFDDFITDTRPRKVR
ncbi:MAG: thermonuclease family protein [Bdellovibrionales bacterium]